MDNFSGKVSLRDIKAYRALYSVQVVIKALGGVYKQRGRDPFELQQIFQRILKSMFDQSNGALGILQVQRGNVTCGDECAGHWLCLLNNILYIFASLQPFDLVVKES